MKNGAPTMKDVAREAGVALGTVSKVFNGIPVGERYRLKVEEAAQRLGYQVNQYARGLKTNKTYVVAVVLPWVNHPIFSALEQHICNALAQRGYRMQLYLTGFDPEQERSCIRLVRQHKVDGIIALTYNPELDVDGIPFVTIDHCFSSAFPCVASDSFGGGRKQAEKLIELGCTHLAFLRTGVQVFGEVDKRGDGFISYCRMQRMPVDVCWLNEEEEIGCFRDFFLKHMTDGKMDIDGIGCSTDLVAHQAINILRDLGVCVPEDVQVIGYDGVRKFGSEELYCSTIVQPVQQMAETCVELLLDPDQAKYPSLICLPVSYAAGGTTKE